MNEKPIWKSKKFVIALAGFAGALVLALLPQVFALDAATQAALLDLLPQVFVVALFLITGHTLMDALTVAKGVQGVSLQQAAHDLIDALPDE